MEELSAWPWPSEAGSAGFELPAAKRRRITTDERTPRAGHQDEGGEEEEYIGSLPAEEVARYENRIDDIHEDMEDLDVEEIKSTVLNSHFSPKSRPSSSGSNTPVPSILSSYTRMDDFTAVVTATVLQALPYLSRLTRLLDIWTVRLLVLRKVPPLLLALDDAEVALKSGWGVIEVPGRNQNGTRAHEDEVLERKSFEIMRGVLQDKVTLLGKDVDYMLDTLEGRQNTLPEIWLDRMEKIERDYGEWVIRGDRKVRAGEWSRMAKARKAEEHRLKLENEAREAARLQAEKKQRERDEKLRLEQEAASRLEREREDVEKKLRLEQEEAAEAAQQAELSRKLEAERIVAEQEAASQEAKRLRVENEERIKLEEAAMAEAAEQTEFERMQEKARMKGEEAERSRLDTEERIRLGEDATSERKLEEDQSTTEDAFRQEKERLRPETEENVTVEQEAAANFASQAELTQEDAFLLKKRQAAEAATANAPERQEPVLKLDDEDRLRDRERVQNEQTADFVDPKNFEPDEAPLPEASTGDSTPDMTSSASALAIGTGVAITGAVQRTRNHEAAKHKTSHEEAGQSLDLASTNDLADSVSSATSAEIPYVPTVALDIRPTVSSTALVRDLSPSSTISRFAPSDGSAEPTFQTLGDRPKIAPPPIEDDALSRHLNGNSTIAASHSQRPSLSEWPQTPDTNPQREQTFHSPTPSTPRGPVTPITLYQPGTASPHGLAVSDERSSPEDDPKSASLRDRFKITQPRTSSQSMVKIDNTGFLGSLQQASPTQTHVPAVGSPKPLLRAFNPASLPSNLAPSPIADVSPPMPLRSSARARIDQEWIVIESPIEDDNQHGSPPVGGIAETDDTSGLKTHKGNIPIVSGYSTSNPTPEIQVAEPTEYFRPMLSPVKSVRTASGRSESASCHPLSDDDRVIEDLSSLVGPGPATDIHTGLGTKVAGETPAMLVSHSSKLVHRSELATDSDDGLESTRGISEKSQLGFSRKTSITRINSPIRLIDVPRRASTSSDASMVLNRQAGDGPSSPLSPCCLLSPLATPGASPNADSESPSKGRVRSRRDSPSDRSTSASPPPIPPMSSRRSFDLLKSPSLNEVETESQGLPSTPKNAEAPIFDNLDVSEASVLSSPKKSSDDQIQAQISSLLETIPARIHLTSEPDGMPFKYADNLRPAKIRRSVTPSLRSHSSLSIRAPTPSFTLAPAYGKGTSRARPQNGNPEIKLYHLSRSTGEAPIKLFVRLVGENGERVMVRVGGGWADLGEYLREYASHHGRRSNLDSDKVEVQDIRPRVTSISSTASTATIRCNGRSSPISRPGSAFDRPMSSLHIRKTRRSVGEMDSSTVTVRNPSTPIPTTSRGREFETAPSEKARSSSRLSWTEEEGGLGLAGPKAKKVVISERDQEWVESMKEKVRLASAEKEKKEARERDRKSFGEMDKVGGTKRLFRKG